MGVETNWWALELKVPDPPDSGYPVSGLMEYLPPVTFCPSNLAPPPEKVGLPYAARVRRLSGLSDQVSLPMPWTVRASAV